MKTTLTMNLSVPPTFQSASSPVGKPALQEELGSWSPGIAARPRLVSWKGAWLVWVCAGALAAHAQSLTQTLSLQAGWNAVWLEVEPPDPAPDAVFAGTPVQIVARYFPRTSPVQFIRDPADKPWNEPGWGVWYAPNRPESVVSSLHAMHGQKAYLVHTATGFVWRLTGKASFARLRWQADSFNLLGLAVDELSPPTFDRFFAGAGGRIGQRIYRLGTGGKWQPVTSPATTRPRAGEAYWVYCQGRTDYQGPLDVTVPGLGELDFGTAGATQELQFVNAANEPVSVAVEVVPASGDLPLVRVTRDLATLRTTYPDLPATSTLGPVAPGRMDCLRLQARRESMTATEQVCLLKLTSSQGARYWVPVRARSSRLPD